MKRREEPKIAEPEFFEQCLNNLLHQLINSKCSAILSKRYPSQSRLSANEQKLVNCAKWNINNIIAAKSKAKQSVLQPIQVRLACEIAAFVNCVLNSPELI